MADIRINALANTASSTASDDYLAVDGTTNGTRKLSAYSPTFGGNLTVSGSVATGYQLYSTTGISYPGVPPGDGFLRAYASTTLGMVWQGQGSTNDLTMINKAGGTVLSVPTGTTNATLAGNLTVSGTGTSSFAGQVNTTRSGASGGAPSNMGFFAGTAIGGSTDGIGIGDSGAGAYKLIQSYSGALSFNPAGNNVLVGTTTDSGNGKLQLATHTTSAGGIGFGTDLSIYRASANTLATKFQSGTKTLYQFGDAYNAGIFDTADAGSGFSGIYFNNGTHSAVIATNGTTAVEFNGSQQAAFSGNVIIASGKVFQLGNAYTAGAPTATGYVTLQDSSGTTYKVLVGT